MRVAYRQQVTIRSTCYEEGNLGSHPVRPGADRGRAAGVGVRRRVRSGTPRRLDPPDPGVRVGGAGQPVDVAAHDCDGLGSGRVLRGGVYPPVLGSPLLPPPVALPQGGGLTQSHKQQQPCSCPPKPGKLLEGFFCLLLLNAIY